MLSYCALGIITGLCHARAPVSWPLLIKRLTPGHCVAFSSSNKENNLFHEETHFVLFAQGLRSVLVDLVFAPNIEVRVLDKDCLETCLEPGTRTWQAD